MFDLSVGNKFQVRFQLQVPNYSVSLEFNPHEFLEPGSMSAFRRFQRIKVQALLEKDFAEEELRDLLLPFMRLFREKIPREDARSNYDVLTLKDVEYRGFWELKCSYSNNVPTLQHYELAYKPTSFELHPHFANGDIVPIINHQDVLIPMRGGIHARNRHFPSESPPQKVTVNGQSFFYHPLPSSSYSMKEEIDEHVRIITSGMLYHDMRILPLCGIVLDDNYSVTGLLKEWQSTYEEDFLERVLLENEIDPDDLRSWVAQFDMALHNMRQAGLGFKPKVWNVAINKNGELWIVYLRDGRVPGIVPGMRSFIKCLEASEAIDNSTTESSGEDDDTDSDDYSENTQGGALL